MVEARAEPVDLKYLGRKLAAFVEIHGGGVARTAGPRLAERRVDQLPLLGRFAIRGFFIGFRHSQKSAGGLAVRRSSLIKGRGTILARFISFSYLNSRMA